MKQEEIDKIKADAKAAAAAAISEGKSQEEADAIEAEILKGITTDPVQVELDRVKNSKWSKKERITTKKTGSQHSRWKKMSQHRIQS